ncbi:MAG TPA: acyltransferase [Candidatus Dormibacteraeota bacterium]
MTPPPRTHLPALDGVRALAVLAVISFHTWEHALPGGWVGVDVFFVLSGYLITSILLHEHGRTGAVSLGRFYLRRALRLLPALGACIVMAVWLAALLRPELGPSTNQEAVFSALYVGNWMIVTHELGGMLGHTWSLSIEEQFYLVWPLLLCALLALGGRRALLAGTVGGAVLVVAHRLTTGGIVQLRTDTRADTLLVGCALAVLVSEGMFERIPRWLVRAAGMAGIGCVVGIGARLGTSTMSGLGYTLSAIAAAAVLATLVSGSWPALSRALSWRPLVAVGRRSYGVYLYHVPLYEAFVQIRHGSGPAALLLTVVLTLVVAWGSYRYLEAPFLRLKDRRTSGRRTAAAAAG